MKTISKIILIVCEEREREREREKKKKKKRVREGQRGGLVGEKERYWSLWERICSCQWAHDFQLIYVIKQCYLKTKK